jgi:GAF domain-containing protein
MARKPRKEGAGSKKRGKSKKSASGRRRAPKRPQKRARKNAAKVAKAKDGDRRVPGPAAHKRELNEARARQAATAEILKIIASSPTDVKPVFNAIVRTVLQVMRCDRAFIMRCEGNSYFPVARATLDGSFIELTGGSQPIDPAANFPSRAIITKKTLYYPDRSLIELPEYERFITEEFGVNSSLFLPLFRKDERIGVLALASKNTHAFSPNDIALAESFRDQALIAIENARLFNETREALAQQTATSEVLQVISSSTGDVQPVFDQLLAKATQVCSAEFAIMGLYEGEVYRRVALYNVPSAFAGVAPTEFRPAPDGPIGTTRQTGQVFRHHDLSKSETYLSRHNEAVVAMVEVAGVRTLVIVPMVRNGETIGAISIYRQEIRPFSDRQVELLRNFASQAVIAIENARLFNETNEALERQTATADILKVIASSPDDVQPVFEAIASSANRLLGAHSAGVMRVIDGVLHLAAFTPVNPKADAVLASTFPMPIATMPFFPQLARGEVHQEPDAELIPVEQPRMMARARGYRSALFVPLMSSGRVIGLVTVSRVEPGAFAAEEVQLLQTFADQAVIAIENVRLFNETKEALERQTATADILKVIASSPDDVQPVFEAIASSANRLLGGHSAGVVRVVDGNLHLAAFTPLNPEADALLTALYPMSTTTTPFFAELARGQPHQEPDSELIPVEQAKLVARARGYRSMLFVPLMNARQVVGLVNVSRVAPGRFAAEEVQLLQTFADQAVIAIENVRLFNETKEALARQTATADILKVISSSIADAKPVFDEILHSVEHLFGADNRMILLAGQDGLVRVGAIHGSSAADALALFPVPLKGLAAEIAFSERRLIAYTDVLNDPGVPEGLRAVARRYGRPYSIAVAPMLTEGRAIGVLNVTREPVRAFTEKECALLQTFADQAVIAIENARLFNETKEALARQTATADVLKVIASSPSNLQPVFDAIAARSKELIGAHSTTVVRYVDDVVELASFTPVSPEADATLRALFPMRPSTDPQFAQILRGEIALIADAESEIRDTPMRESARARGWRSRLLVPLKGDVGVIGWISITRKEAGAFAEKDVELLRTFADQAVIAIQNVELFEQVQAKTRDLEESLQQQTATADVLKVISRSTFDLETVLHTLLSSAAQLCQADHSFIFLREGEAFRFAAGSGGAPEWTEYLKQQSIQPGRGTIAARAVLEARTIHIPDVLADPEYTFLEAQKRGGFRTALGVPLLREGVSIGVMVLTRPVVRPFDDSHVALVTTFADQAVIAIENIRLFNETREALARQTATADVLKVIASSPSNLQPVFDAIAERSNELIGGHSTTVFRFNGDIVELAAATSVGEEADAVLRAAFPRPISAMQGLERIFRGELMETVDATADTEPELTRTIALARGFRSRLHVPLKGDNAVIGWISITRKKAGPFAEKDVELLRTFADQAVIAIQNVELFEEVQARTRDLTESLQQQTATADVLKVISRSAFDLQTVLDTLVESAYRLCGASLGLLYLRDDADFECKAIAGVGIEAATQLFKGRPIRAGRGTAAERVILTGEVHAVTDFFADPEFDPVVRERIRNDSSGSDISQLRSTLAVPMTREDEVVGVLVIARTQTGSFPQRQIELLQTFADQAVIAIENLRLFNETKEALARQTATADVLKVIASSPSNLQPVFDAIAARSKELVAGHSTTVFRFAGDMVELVGATSVGEEADAVLRATFPMPVSRMRNIEKILRGEISEIVDVLADTQPDDSSKDVARARGWRSRLVVPLKGDSAVIGFISITRKEPGTFADKDKELVRTFADQAVIAIQNVELFEEVQARTRDLEESLQQQTATADVLKVISRSAFDLDAVMNTLTRSARHLCGADGGALFLRDGDRLVCRGVAAVKSADEEFLRANPVVPLNDQSHIGRAVLSGTIANVGDIESNLQLRKYQQAMGFKAFLAVPLMREGRSVGGFSLVRDQVGEFTPRQIELVQTFADQAVIAIENARLFDEVQAKTRDLEESLQFQTATSDVLKVISRSPDKLQPVLDAIVETSRELCGSDASTIFLFQDGKFHFTAVAGDVPKHVEMLRANPMPIDEPGSMFGRMIQQKRTLRFDNIMDDPELSQSRVGLGGPRALLVSPLLNQGVVIGALVLRQSHLKPFTERQIQAIEVFADQAVIAISNVGLFEQVQQRTRELSQSLDDLRAAQDRLVQTEKLASLGQLTAGIAHEIKNPLNFVNNFSALSVELTDELNDVLKQAELAEKIEREVRELTQLLKSNLEKIVQHGKRADSIVKNMLLHSREGSGEQRDADINALVEESLNLAYHGARAEKAGFDITLQREFDAGAGSAELFPQEMTRALLNLISNGFYAATRRKAENGDGAFEPTLFAKTRNLGHSVEIRIRDNGAGIPPDVKEKMFNPFFTTKPAGEGTGLGLSMTHDIIVKQHGGTIDVATEPGNFTEFIVVLPRANGAQKTRGQA